MSRPRVRPPDEFASPLRLVDPFVVFSSLEFPLARTTDAGSDEPLVARLLLKEKMLPISFHTKADIAQEKRTID
jgi:hypothetical protein